MHAMRTALAGALLAACTAPALAGTVTVITSFPKDLTQAYKTAFEKANPGITLEILCASRMLQSTSFPPPR